MDDLPLSENCFGHSAYGSDTPIEILAVQGLRKARVEPIGPGDDRSYDERREFSLDGLLSATIGDHRQLVVTTLSEALDRTIPQKGIQFSVTGNISKRSVVLLTQKNLPIDWDLLESNVHNVIAEKKSAARAAWNSGEKNSPVTRR